MSLSELAVEADAQIRIRKERIHTTMLVELLALLVFMSMGFAFVSRDQAQASSLADRIDVLERELAAKDLELRTARAEIRELHQINQELADSIRRLRNDPNVRLRANPDLVMLPEARFREMTANLENQGQIINAQQREVRTLNQRLASSGRGGAGLPNCPVTASFIVSIDALGDGSYVVTPQWPAPSAPSVQRVPGVMALATGRRVSRGEFQSLAQQMSAWGAQQTVPCGFRARVRARHSNLQLFQQQYANVSQYFYLAWR